MLLVEQRAVQRDQHFVGEPRLHVASRKVAIHAVAGALRIRVQHLDLAQLQRQLEPRVRVEVVTRKGRRFAVGMREVCDDLRLQKGTSQGDDSWPLCGRKAAVYSVHCVSGWAVLRAAGVAMGVVVHMHAACISAQRMRLALLQASYLSGVTACIVGLSHAS